LARALLWVKNDDHQWNSPDWSTVADARLTLTGLAPGCWQGQWWDTWAGAPLGDISLVAGPLPPQLPVPPFEGDVTHGLLPVLADRFVAAEQRRMPSLELAQEGRARVNNAVGYEVGYERITDTERFTGRDVLLVPDDPAEGRGQVLLSLRQRKDSGAKLTPPERNLAYLARKTYRSFRFGTERG